MYETLKRLYDDVELSKEGLRKAVSEKRWIDEDQYKLITGEDYTA